jgi:hypothetical protein
MDKKTAPNIFLKFSFPGCCQHVDKNITTKFTDILQIFLFKFVLMLFIRPFFMVNFVKLCDASWALGKICQTVKYQKRQVRLSFSFI